MDCRLFIAAVGVLVGCSTSTQRELERITAVSDPAALALEQGYNDYVHRSFLPGGIETGVIQCEDGASSKYWFRSHHLSDDMGGTLFHFSDGTKVFMSGWFCCEVQLPDRQFASLAQLRAFIREHNGTGP